MDNMVGILLLLVVLGINVAISTWNAYLAGRMWNLAEGFGATVLLICALVQSVVGYSSALVVVGVMGAYGTGYLDQEYLKYAMDLWYLAVIFPALGTGMIIWLHSVLHAIRNPSVGNYAVAGWNTFAQLHNMWGALDQIPKSTDGVSELFKGLSGGKSGGKMDAKAVLVIIIVVVALSLAILATAIVFIIGRQATLAEIGNIRQRQGTRRQYA